MGRPLVELDAARAVLALGLAHSLCALDGARHMSSDSLESRVSRLELMVDDIDKDLRQIRERCEWLAVNGLTKADLDDFGRSFGRRFRQACINIIAAMVVVAFIALGLTGMVAS